MKLFDELNDDNFELFAIRNYYNPTCVDAEEFYEDLKRFKYIKRLITRYLDNEEPPVNLLLNHLVIIFNVFGYDAGLKMLEFRVMNDENIGILKPFLIFLNAIPNDKYTGIKMDSKIIEKLRNL
jgi:hypothetical protein